MLSRSMTQASSTVRVRQPRPDRLSDPFSDFTPASLKRLLAVPDDKMGWSELQQLFGPFLPAGTYDESVYFLPHALEHLITHEHEALDLETAVIWFCSEYAERLEADHYLPDVKGQLLRCLKAWTRDFRVQHYDADACARKGWGCRRFDHVLNSELVCQSLEDLVRFERHRDVALEFFHSLLGNLAQPLAASWFLELARARSDVYQPPNDPEFSGPLCDRSLLARAAVTVLEKCVPTEALPTYWDDTFTLLEL